MAKRKRNPGTLVRFVTRAISDASKSFYFEGRIGPLHARLYAETAVSAVARGKKRGCRS